MKIDLHVHTSEVSACGKLTVEEVLRLYREHGFDAVVITNHFNRWTADHWAQRGVTDFVKLYFDVVREGKALAPKYDMTVLAGCELRFDCNDNDYLVYGVTEELLRDCETLFALDLAGFAPFAREHDLLIYQAHPFRDRMTVTDPAPLFGIEVKNGCPRHDSRNDIAEAWADRFHLRKIAGSDCHRAEDVGQTGIESMDPISTEADLVRMLKEGRYRIL